MTNFSLTKFLAKVIELHKNFYKVFWVILIVKYLEQYWADCFELYIVFDERQT